MAKVSSITFLPSKQKKTSSRRIGEGAGYLQS